MKKHLKTILAAFAACSLIQPALISADNAREGCHVEEVTDIDGDMQILMESEWISMYLMPSLQSTIVRFTFRPTGNDIVEPTVPKITMAGGGLLQDNFWGQDWRYSEFRGRFYEYKIEKNTPEEVAVSFETKSEGWLQADKSGVVSKLWSNIRLRRTVRLKSGSPYFLFDLELINEDKNSKLPFMWVHNSSLCDRLQGDFVYRPSTLGVREIGEIGNLCPTNGDNYIYDFNEGWSAVVSPVRKEGVVYLMDYDYLSFLYNCSTNTTEWVYDNVLISPKRPWKGRTYILPVIGLSRVDFASENFIFAIHPEREKGRLDLNYKVTASYEPVKRITFNTDLVWGHYRGEGHPDDPQTVKLEPVEVQGLGISPVDAHVILDNPPPDPLLLNIKAHIEMPDGTVKTRRFQAFHAGEYKFQKNVRMDMSTPVVKLDRPDLKPWLPVPEEGLKVSKGEFKVFAMLGNHSHVLGIRKIIRDMGVKLEEDGDIGYTPGFYCYDNGLTDYPYDYDRLFGYRVFLWSNSNVNVARMVGASVLANYLKAGGSLVMTGGDNAFQTEYTQPENDLNGFIPIKPRENNIFKGALQLNSPAKDHPVFKGIDLSNMPFAFYTHDVELKDGMDAKVLLKVGERPFIVESGKNGQRTLVVLSAPFGDETEFPGKTPFWKWSEWSKLFANILKYAGHEM